MATRTQARVWNLLLRVTFKPHNAAASSSPPGFHQPSSMLVSPIDVKIPMTFALVGQLLAFVDRARRKDTTPEDFLYRHDALAGDNDDDYDWLRTVNLGAGYKDSGRALGRCLTRHMRHAMQDHCDHNWQDFDHEWPGHFDHKWQVHFDHKWKDTCGMLCKNALTIDHCLIWKVIQPLLNSFALFLACNGNQVPLPSGQQPKANFSLESKRKDVLMHLNRGFQGKDDTRVHQEASFCRAHVVVYYATILLGFLLGLPGLKDFSLLPRWFTPPCFSRASSLPSFAVYKATPPQKDRAQDWLDAQLLQLPYSLAWAVLCVLSAGALHVWHLAADAVIAGDHGFPGGDKIDEVGWKILHLAADAVVVGSHGLQGDDLKDGMVWEGRALHV
eukprot:1162021-Pelagomonas_calceolata.AAC.4